MPYPRLRRLVLPWTRRELPGTHRLLRLVAGAGEADAAWRDVRPVVTRGKTHRYRMRLDLANWADRHAYFLGRSYEAAVELTLMRLVGPGERVLDVGANHGMLSLLLAHLVGPAGRVDAFEPNPRCLAVLREQVALNRIRHLHVHDVALSDAAGEAEFFSVPAHTGYGTLGAIGGGDAGFHETFRDRFHVRVVRGDEALSDRRSISLIKIDVEGYEAHALRGLRDTLRRDRPALVTEVNPYCLGRAGSSVATLHAMLGAQGYHAFGIGCHETRWRREAVFTPAPTPADLTAHDALWLHADDPRLSGLPTGPTPQRLYAAAA